MLAGLMDGRLDYTHYTHAELLEALGAIDRDRYPENFKRLIAALDKHRSAAADLASPQSVLPSHEGSGAPLVAQPEPVAVRLSPGRGPLGWIEPARNSFHLVGTGFLSIGQDSIRVSGRRLLLLLGLPVMRHIDLDRRYIRNVEVLSNTVRLEYRAPDAATRALTVWLDDSAMAARVAAALPGERTEDFQPQLQEEIAFAERLQARSRYAPITMALVALNVLVFVTGLIKGDFALLVPNGNAYVPWGSNFGPYTTAGDWWRLLTGMFLHLGILHLVFNMWALASFGPITERLLGSTAYAIVYVFTGLAAGCTSIAWQPAVNTVGASGAIFGLFGALVAELIASNQSISRTLLKALRASTLMFTVYVLCIGFLTPGVDNAAHVGGLVCGFALGLVHSIGQRIGPWDKLRGVVASMAVIVVGALFVSAGTALALHRSDLLEGESLYLQTRQWLIRNENIAIDNQRIAWKQAQDGKIIDDAFADSIEASVLPIWKEAERRLAAIELPAESALHSDLRYLRELTKSRRTAYELCAAGARAHSTAAVNQCIVELRRSDGLVQAQQARNAAKRGRAN